ncbi:hypothetical protein J6590_032011 [Homalodisca vitripennis]|nr:hypothetical protein J6590_032011 [Homalodisca vitripennis]
MLASSGTPPGISTPSGSDVTAGGANSAHGHGPGTELAPPDYKGVLIQRMGMGVLIQRMDMAQSLN